MIYSNEITIYIVDNTAPAVAQNFQASFPVDQHPSLSWNANTEYDLKGYRVYKQLTTSSGTITNYAFTTNTSYTDNDFIVDNPRFSTDRGEYWIVSEDINGNLSAETSHYDTDGHSIIQWKTMANNSKDFYKYSLYQNYPNPFNPSSNISYSLQNDGLVRLNVYDILGNEIVELVNEFKEKGEYNVEFIAKNLPSGIYIYHSGK